MRLKDLVKRVFGASRSRDGRTNDPVPINGKIVNSVLIGGEGELYLGAGAHNVLKFATGEARVDAESIKNFELNVQERKKYCKDRGIPLLQMIAPEKYKVIPDGFPLESPLSFYDNHVDCSAHGVWYPVNELKNNRFGRSYYKTDTHWTAAGLKLVTLKMAETAGFDAAAIERLSEVLERQTKPHDQTFYGDLGRKLDPKEGEEVSWPHRAPTVKSVENGIGHDYANPVNDGRIIFSRNSASISPKTVLIFGDSYLFNGLAYIECAFQNVVLCRTRFFHREMVEMVKPDLIVCQAAERYLRVVTNDEKAPPLLFLPYVLGRTPKMEPQDAAFASSFLSSGRDVDFKAYGVEFTND